MTIPENKEIPIELVQFLVADDHRFVRLIVGDCLKMHHVRFVSFAEDGEDALSLLVKCSGRAPNLRIPELNSECADRANDTEGAAIKAAHAYCVITDLNMGKINGLHLLKAIRCGATGVPRDTPVIMLTGHSERLVVSAALQLDVSAFVVKPVSNRGLWEKVQRALKAKPSLKDAAVYRNTLIPGGDAWAAASEAKTAESSRGLRPCTPDGSDAERP